MKFGINIIVPLLVIVGFHSCSPKNKAVVETTPEVIQPAYDTNNPCRKLSDLDAGRREEAETAYAIYKDQMMLKKWDAARRVWSVGYQLAPATNGSVTGHFSDGVTIYSELAKATSDQGLRVRYVDTIRMINAKYEQCFTVDGATMSRRAYDYYYALDSLISEDEKWATFIKAIELNKGKMVYFTINPFTSMLVERIITNRISFEEGRKYVNIVQKSIEEGSKNCKGAGCEGWDVVKSYAPDRLESLEGIDDFYDCTYYADKYFALYKLYPDSCDVITTAYARMLRGKCLDSDPRIIEVRAKRNAQCIEASVTQATGPLRLGYDAYGEGRYSQAVNYFEEYIKSTDDNEKKAKYALLIAKIYYGDLRNFSQSRKWAYEAAKYKKGWGDPYILIGKLYASSGPLCGPGRGFASQVVTWPAIDKFAYAKSIDPSVSGEANRLINQYTKYMPSNEDIFQRTEIKEGSSYFVGCWIQESTRVRAAP